MRKKLKRLLVFQIVLFFSVECHLTPAYNHDSASSLDNSKWMSGLKDQVFLYDLSLPGTHETMAKGHGGDIAQCQSLSLTNQLISGIRAFDIRCRHIQNKFAIHHGIIFLDKWFGNVLNEMVEFLMKNPSEFLFVRVKETYKGVNNNRSFQETFEFYRNEDFYSNYFWKSNPPEGNQTINLLPIIIPRVKDVRGKIIILDDFSMNSTIVSKYGLAYRNTKLFKIQDHFRFKTNWDLYGKWTDVKKWMGKAEFSRDAPGENNNAFYVNYLSGSFGSFPFFVASGHLTHHSGGSRLNTGLLDPLEKNTYPDFPRVYCFIGICTIAFEGTNVLVYNFLTKKSKDFKYVGIIMADFPGDGLIQSVIEINAHNFKPSSLLGLNRFIIQWGFVVVASILILLMILICFYWFTKRREIIYLERSIKICKDGKHYYEYGRLYDCMS